MKKYLIPMIAMAVLFMSIILTVKSVSLNLKLSHIRCNDVFALAYSNEKAGAQGERHPQAVQCKETGWFSTGWKVRAGCCYGWEECQYDGCSGANYSCDGVNW